jgi:leucyl aminopeptidase
VLVSATTQAPAETEADTVAVGVFADGELPAGLPGQLAQLLSSGEARGSFGALALTHSDGKRWLLVGLGEREAFTPERARVAAAKALERAKEISARILCWLAPSGAGDDVAGALIEGTILRDYSFELYKSAPADQSEPTPKHLDGVILAGTGQLDQAVERAAVVAQAANAARDLQNRPGNDLTPSALAEYARTRFQSIDSVTVHTEGRAGILARRMDAFAAVAQGSEQEPALIELRYEPPGASGPLLAFVGKAVTFDSGGISLKPGPKMSEMKFDMSGGAAVIESIAAIAAIKLPVRLIGVVGATENLPSGHAMKPGDIVRASNGKTIEINNTDAEGRLVLADCLSHAVGQGAERIVDLATLTGAVIIALGSTHAGLMSNDDEFAQRVETAGRRTGEIVWRLPFHEEHDEMVKGKYADLDNAPEERKAGTVIAATFLKNFVEDIPWAHVDIAGSAWNLGRAYAPKSASGYGVRLLVELAKSYCA